jgi:exodeoxyribonuclease VII small subunit
MSADIKKKTYGEAIGELKAIVEKLRDQSEDIDVDQLLTDVKTAKELIGVCEEKLSKADVAISAVLKEIRKEDVDDSPSFSPDEDDTETPFTPAGNGGKEEIPF